MICSPEVPFNVEHFIEKVRAMQEKKPSIVIAVSRVSGRGRSLRL